MWEDQYEGTVRAAAQATRARIRRDATRAPRALSKVFSVVASKLLQSSLDANKAWRVAGIRDSAMTTVFKREIGTSLRRYIAAARIEVADVLLAATDLDPVSISMKVGFDYYPTFVATFESVKGIKPADVARPPSTRPVIVYKTNLAAVRGLLDDDAVIAYVKDLLRLYPSIADRIRGGAAATEPQIRVDGARCEELQAQGLWQMIRDLPFEEQCREVRRYLFGSEVFFDLLRKKSRREGRKSRQRGVELAQLALVSLETSEQVSGERIHDLRALGWAWVGNAHRLALDFSAAAAAFEQADREWSEPRETRDLTVLAHTCHRRGTLRMMQRDHAEATRDLDRSCSLFRQSAQPHAEARALISRAMNHGYAGELGEAVKDLREAAGLIDEDQEKELAFAIRGNLANALVRAGQVENAAKELDRARELYRFVDDPQGAIKLDWIEGDLGELRGDLESARRLYASVRDRVIGAEEPRLLGIVSVDLMTIHSKLGEWERVKVLASKTLPILDSLRLYRETVAAVRLLAQAVEGQGLSRQLLKKLRAALRQDPLAGESDEGGSATASAGHKMK